MRQAPISLSVRIQPMHIFVVGLIVHTPTQGEAGKSVGLCDVDGVSVIEATLLAARADASKVSVRELEFGFTGDKRL